MMKAEFKELLEKLRDAAIAGTPADIDSCMQLAEAAQADSSLIDDICDAADAVRSAHDGDRLDTCSIINGRSGRCSENCKWCAQAASHHTGCQEYDFIPEQEVLDAVDRNTRMGVNRFSIVCSGRRVAMKDIRRYCEIYRKISERSPIKLCASMGLLDREALQALYDAGIRRYHCNLETAPSFFPSLCTSHTVEDKLRTIRLAREVGMQVCSGGIIGMGETLRQRLELAEAAVGAGACSIPVNLLCPIEGTPLANTPLLPEEEIILSIALMRLVAPKATLRFAGGRARLSRKTTIRILKGGLNGALVGDMLTTVGNHMQQDFEMFRDLGYEA